MPLQRVVEVMKQLHRLLSVVWGYTDDEAAGGKKPD